jgi:hypothetical protein
MLRTTTTRPKESLTRMDDARSPATSETLTAGTIDFEQVMAGLDVSPLPVDLPQDDPLAASKPMGYTPSPQAS